MARIEQVEMDAHWAQLAGDVGQLVEKFRSIFAWDVPEIDERAADEFIFAAIRKALDNVEQRATTAA